MKWKCLILIFTILWVYEEGQAKHIIGGDVTYECLGNGKYRITMYVYRDCRPQAEAAELDADASIAVYRENDRGHILAGSFPARLLARDYIDAPDYPCLILPAGLCVERGKYEFEITIPDWPGDHSYYIIYQRCCRNNTISNLVDPGSIGATFYVEITKESMAECNSSPTFDEFPPTVVCVDQEFEFDHSVTDPEGDSIVYRFATPLAGGGLQGSSFTNPGNPEGCRGVKPTPPCPPPFETARFQLSHYSESNPMGGDPQVTINPNTGLITGRPKIQGQFVIRVIAEEYKNGKKIGEISRDFQFNVAQCDPTVFARIKSAVMIDESNAFMRSCGEFTIPFRDSSFEQRFIETYEWQFEIGEETVVYNQKDVDVTFPALGDYKGKLVVNKGTECSDSTNIEISVLPDIQADFVFDYDTCIAGDVKFLDNGSFSEAPDGIQEYKWEFGDGNGSMNQNPSHFYETSGLWEVSLTVSDENQCEDTKTAQVSYYPVPAEEAIREQVEIACLPASVIFDNLPPPVDPTYDIRWDFGDGNKGSGFLPEHIYTEEGDFDIRVDIVSPIGCKVSAFFPRMITTQPSPVADFSYSPKRPTSLDKFVQFVNHSEAAAAYVWEIDRLGNYSDIDLGIEFPDTGIYHVSLIAIHENNCKDTLTELVDIEPIVLYTVPNAFSPNKDGFNDEFKGVGVFAGMKNFEMTVYDRWGNIIFTSFDPEKGWDGTVMEGEKKAPPGVYVYLVQYLDPRNRPEKYYGEVMLIN